MIKAVLFDLDNTLVDFMRMKKASCEEAIAAMIDAGLAIRKEKAIKVLYELYQEHGMEDKEIFQKLLHKTAGSVDYKVLAAGIIAYRRVKAGYLAPYPGVTSTLLAIRKQGIKLAIVSDAPRMRAWLRLASMRLMDFFDVVVTFDDTKKYKPHPDPFKAALEKLRLPPEQVLMVGDWPERDMKGARKLGIRTCWARYGDFTGQRRSRSDYCIDDIRKLLDVIKKENAK